MKRFMIVFSLFFVLAPAALAYKTIDTLRNATAYVQDGNQNLC